MSELTLQSAWEHATGGPWPDPDTLCGDEKYIALAILESLAGIGYSSPNPSVGCVLVRAGRIIGRGTHLRAGGRHAEVAAIQDSRDRNETTDGATAFVTMEPCCHTGRTPPCTDAIIRSGIKRVVFGVRDPNPRVSGGGVAVLLSHGIEVTEGILGSVCARLHAPFFKLLQTGIPWVMLKLALGKDGRIGPKGARVNVTPPDVQSHAHALRRVCDGIIVGRNTVAIDDPLLTDRWQGDTEPIHGNQADFSNPGNRIFRRIVLDSRGSLGVDRQIWRSTEGHATMRVMTKTTAPIEGVEDLRLPPGPGGCSLPHLLHELSIRGLSRVLVEGGPSLANHMLEADLVDVLHIFRSSKPAGGPAVILKMDKFGPPKNALCFDGGRWEIYS